MKNAFSLVEVLIAMVIVSMLTATGMFAYKLALSEVKRQKTIKYSEAIHFRELENLFNGTYFYVIEKKDLFITDSFQYNYLFKKSKLTIEFVSEAPIYSNHLSLIRLTIDKDRLLYQEKAIYNGGDYKHPTIDKHVKRYTLFNNIEKAEFSYEEPIDLPKDNHFTTTIPKIVILKFRRDNKEYKYIFDIKYNFYKLKLFLIGNREFS